MKFNATFYDRVDRLAVRFRKRINSQEGICKTSTERPGVGHGRTHGGDEAQDGVARFVVLIFPEGYRTVVTSKRPINIVSRKPLNEVQLGLLRTNRIRMYVGLRTNCLEQVAVLNCADSDDDESLCSTADENPESWKLSRSLNGGRCFPFPLPVV